MASSPSSATASDGLQCRIQDFVKGILVALSYGKLPSVSIPKYRTRLSFSEGCRSGIYEKAGNCEVLGLQHSSTGHRLVVMLRVLGIVQQLLEQDKHASKRDIFYTDPSVFHDMSMIDQAVNDICSWFDCSRNSLHVVAVSKGLVLGWLSYTDSDRRVDCMKCSCTGIPIPVHSHHVREIKSLAEYVLLVEKETVFQRLADDGFCLRNRCIIITGKGYPDVATRRWFYSIFENT